MKLFRPAVKLGCFAQTLLLTLSLLGCDERLAQSPGERFIEALEIIRDGKPKEMLNDYMHKQDSDAASDFYDALSEDMPKRGPITSFEVEHENFENDVVYVKIRWCVKEQCGVSIEAAMRFEGGKWRLSLNDRVPHT